MIKEFYMLTHKKLRTHYEKEKDTIKKRLKEFSANGKDLDPEGLFTELCFCICTPQSKAVKVAEVIHLGNSAKLLSMDHAQLSEFLKKNTRFHNTKAKHIIHARKYLSELSSLPKDSLKAREFLVKNIKGIGYKESSHYLRNIGYRNLCIVDRHVINLMHELGVFKDASNPSTPKRYLDMEQKIKDYAKAHGYDVDELDLALWSVKTGHVFK